MKSLLCLLLWLAVVEGAEPSVRIIDRSEMAASKLTTVAQGAFERFSAAYRMEMAKREIGVPRGAWEFWVVLRADPKNNHRPHILVVGHNGRLLVRIADIPATASLDVGNEAPRSAASSIRLMAASGLQGRAKTAPLTARAR